MHQCVGPSPAFDFSGGVDKVVATAIQAMDEEYKMSAGAPRSARRRRHGRHRGGMVAVSFPQESRKVGNLQQLHGCTAAEPLSGGCKHDKKRIWAQRIRNQDIFLEDPVKEIGMGSFSCSRL